MSEYDKAVEIADNYMQFMSTKNYDGVLTLYAENATLEDPVGSEILQGTAAISTIYHGIGDTELTCNRTGPVRFANREMVFPFECLMTSDEGVMRMEIIDHFVLNEDNLIVAMRAFWGPESASMVE